MLSLQQFQHPAAICRPTSLHIVNQRLGIRAAWLSALTLPFAAMALVLTLDLLQHAGALAGLAVLVQQPVNGHHDAVRATLELALLHLEQQRGVKAGHVLLGGLGDQAQVSAGDVAGAHAAGFDDVHLADALWVIAQVAGLGGGEIAFFDQLLLLFLLHQALDCYGQSLQFVHLFNQPHVSTAMPSVVTAAMAIWTQGHTGVLLPLLDVVGLTRAGRITD